jgi:hypothetical protein
VDGVTNTTDVDGGTGATDVDGVAGATDVDGGTGAIPRCSSVGYASIVANGTSIQRQRAARNRTAVR